MTSKLSVQADVHNTSAISGGSGSSVHSDIFDIIPKDILADIELEKTDLAYTSMLTEELMKLKSKEEEEKLCFQEEEQKDARCKAQELWAKKKKKELQVKIEEEIKHAEQVKLEKIKREKELEAEKLKQKCYDAYKGKTKGGLMKKIEKEKEELEMQEVEANYKAEITAELREEYGISKMVPLDNPRHPPPGNSNVGFGAIKTEPLAANDLANSVKTSGPTKRHLDGIDSHTPPKKKVASAAKFNTLMTPKKPKTSVNGGFALPKPTFHYKYREEPTFGISNQDIYVPSPM